MCMYTQHVSYPRSTDGRTSLLLRGQEDKVGLRVCAMLALSIHTLMMCMYLLLRGKEDKVTLSVCTHFLYPFTQRRPVRWKRCTGQDTQRERMRASRCLQAGQPLHTLPVRVATNPAGLVRTLKIYSFSNFQIHDTGV